MDPMDICMGLLEHIMRVLLFWGLGASDSVTIIMWPHVPRIIKCDRRREPSVMRAGPSDDVENDNELLLLLLLLSFLLPATRERERIPHFFLTGMEYLWIYL